MTRRDPHPLRPAQIVPAPEPGLLDPRGPAKITDRAFPTGATARSVPAFRFRPTDPPRTTSTPVTFSPTMLEPGGGMPEASTTPTIDEVRRRLKP
jgi:hypothetical protein